MTIPTFKSVDELRAWLGCIVRTMIERDVDAMRRDGNDDEQIEATLPVLQEGYQRWVDDECAKLARLVETQRAHQTLQ